MAAALLMVFVSKEDQAPENPLSEGSGEAPSNGIGVEEQTQTGGGSDPATGVSADSTKPMRRDTVQLGVELIGNEAELADLDGTFRYFSCTPEVIEYLTESISPSISGVIERTQLLEGLIVAGQFDSPLLVEPDLAWFGWLEAPGFYCEPAYFDPAESSGSVAIKAKRCSNFKVRVVSDEGERITGIQVELTRNMLDTNFVQKSWEHKLRTVFYYRIVESDDAGIAEFDSYPEGLLTVAGNAAGLFGGSVRHEVESSSTVTLTMPSAAAVVGEVLTDDGTPVVGARIYALAPDEWGNTRGVGAATTTDSGKYELSGVGLSSDLVVLVLVAEGFAASQQTLLNPIAGATYVVDFVAEESVALELRVVDASGAAVEGLGVSLRDHPNSWIPGFYVTPESGVIETENNLIAGREYLVDLRQDGDLVQGLQVVVPDSAPYRAELVADRIGLIESVTLSGNSESLAVESVVFIPAADHEARYWAWDGGGKPPWLPAAAGRIQVKMANGERFSREVAVLPGKQVVEIAIGRAPLRFSIENADQHIGAQIRVLSIDGSTIQDSVVREGDYELTVPHGKYHLSVSVEGEEFYRSARFAVSADGRDLGAISVSRSASISGSVTDEDGRGWRDVGVECVYADSGQAVYSTTDKDGQFVFPCLPGGSYKVVIRPYKTHLVPAPNLSQSLTVREGHSILNLRFVLQESGHCRVQVQDWSAERALGFFLIGSQLSYMEVGAQGLFEVGVLNPIRGVVGVCEATGSRIRLLATQRKLEPNKTMPLEALPPFSRQVQVLDATGSPVSGARITLSLHGVTLPVVATTDSRGRFTLGSAGGDEALVRVRHSEAGYAAETLASLSDGGQVTLGHEGATALVSVLGLASSPISGACVSSTASGESRLSDSVGEASLRAEAMGSPIWVEKNGYWPVKVPSGSQVSATLRRMGCGLELEVADGLDATRLNAKPRFFSGYEWKPLLERDPQDPTRWTAADLPEGEYQIFAFNDRTEIVAQGTVTLRPGEVTQAKLR